MKSDIRFFAVMGFCSLAASLAAAGPAADSLKAGAFGRPGVI